MQSSRVICLVIAVAVIGATLLAALPASAAPIEIHGWVLDRLYMPQGEPTHFQIERISLSAKATLDPKTEAYVEWYFHEWIPTSTSSSDVSKFGPAEQYRYYLESAYVDLKEVAGGTIRAGKGRSYCFGLTPTYGMRKTSNYGILSEAFTQDRVVGVQYMRKQSNGGDWAVGVFNTERLANRKAGDIGTLNPSVMTVKHLVDKDVPADQNHNLEVAARLTEPVNDEVSVGLSARRGKLDNEDMGFIATNFGDKFVGGRAKTRYGIAATARSQNGNGLLRLANLEYYWGQASRVKQAGWALLVGAEPKDPMAIKAYARFGSVDIDVPRTSNQLSWDVKQVQVSVVKPLRKTVWLQFEYEHNSENAPAGSPELGNNVFFTELFFGF